MTNGAYSEVVDACNRCADACDTCLSACLLEPEVADMTRCIALDLECAAACRLLAGFGSRGSKFAPHLAAFCAEIAQACADECGRHPHDHCQASAAACRDCKAVCDRLAQLPVQSPAEVPAESVAAQKR